MMEPDEFYWIKAILQSSLKQFRIAQNCTQFVFGFRGWKRL